MPQCALCCRRVAFVWNIEPLDPLPLCFDHAATMVASVAAAWNLSIEQVVGDHLSFPTHKR